VKPDDQPHRIIVEHLDGAVLLDTHRYAEEFAPIGHVAPEGEGIAFSGLTHAYETHVVGFPLIGACFC